MKRSAALLVTLIGLVGCAGPPPDQRTALSSPASSPDEELRQLLTKQREDYQPVIIEPSRRMLEELVRRRKCQQPKDDPKKAQYHALADRLESANWSENDPCFQLHPLKPLDGDSGPYDAS